MTAPRFAFRGPAPATKLLRMEQCIRKVNIRRPHQHIMLWKACDGHVGDVLKFWVIREEDDEEILEEATVVVSQDGVLDDIAAAEYFPDPGRPEPPPSAHEREQLLESYAHAHAVIVAGPETLIEDLRTGEALVTWPSSGGWPALQALVALTDLRSELHEMIRSYAPAALLDIDFLLELGAFMTAVERGEPQATMTCGLTVHTQRARLRSSWERLLDLTI